MDGVVRPEHIRILVLPKLVDQIVFLFANLRPVGGLFGTRDAREGVVATPVLGLGRPNERLARHTTYVDAGSSQRAAFDQRNTRSLFRTSNGGRKSGRPSAEHREVKVHRGRRTINGHFWGHYFTAVHRSCFVVAGSATRAVYPVISLSFAMNVVGVVLVGSYLMTADDES